ncbi:MAG: ChbG/HpnK family deacetylase [bacterium]
MVNLIVNADDFGLTVATNHAIHRSYRNGIVTSASLLSNFTAFDHAISISKKNQDLGIGIHYNLLDGDPVLPPSKVPSLVNKYGKFIGSPLKLFSKIILGRTRKDEVELELRAQTTKVLKSGIDVFHFDGHQHIHVFPPILKILLEIAREFGIKALRYPSERFNFSFHHLKPKFIIRHIVRFLIYQNCRCVKSMLNSYSMHHPDNFYGIIDVGNINEGILKKKILSLKNGVNEIMVHPSLMSKALERMNFPWIKNHCFLKELDAVINPKMMQLIKGKKINLTHFGSII